MTGVILMNKCVFLHSSLAFALAAVVFCALWQRAAHCFQSAYTLLAEDADANRAFCSEVYGCLLIFPDRAKAHMAEIAAGMQALSDDIRDETAYLRMSALRIALQC